MLFENEISYLRKVLAEDDVYTALDELSKMYGFKSAKQVFKILSSDESEEFKYYKVQQKYNGISVYEKQLVVTVNKDNKVVSVTGHFYKDINVSTYGSFNVDEAKKKDIRILTVGLGSEVDSSNLQNIASLTNGKYFYADSSTDLYKFDYKIFAEIE